MENQELTNYILMALIMVMVLTIIIIVSIEYMRKKVLNEKMLNAELKLKHQTELLHTVIRSQEEERRRVSDALHDDIGSKLTTLKLSLHQLFSAGQYGKLGEELIDLSEKVVDRTREISHAYSPLIVEKFGLQAGLEELIHDLVQDTVPKVDLKFSLDESKLDKETRLILFRIFQELLNNTMKHANALNVGILIETMDDQLIFTYYDDGKGMNIKTSSAGIGMLNIRNRVEMMDGQMNLHSKLGEGFRITIKKQLA
ncbi:sensor histidine kinase [Echinicola shivajiensis]|uniref:sensor histidine kinase n=1 Tax=Echinicola shivajiensis TaxID=1035916 RepID=UPI001BFC176A|nr:ATP-binding protein [Echinicola shivajiensis]